MIEASIVTMLARMASSPRGSRLAVSCEQETRTFEELYSRSRQLAAGLAEAGVARGDRVAVLLANRIEWVELLFGIAAAGGVCVPVSKLLRPSEVAHVCADSGARWIVADAEGLPLLEELPADVATVVVGAEDAGRGLPYERLFAAGDGASIAGPGIDDLAILYYSSGTTGAPKAAAHTHGGVLWNAFGQIPDLKLTPEDVYLSVPSLSWAAGFNDLFLSLMWIGGRSVILPSHATAIESIVDHIDTSGATRTLLVPTLVKQLLDHPDLLERVRRSELRWFLSGGEPIPRAVIERINEELPGCRLAQGYGMSEFPTVATILQPEHAVSHAGTAGRALCHTQIAVREAGGAIVSSGEGEVLLRSLATMREYFGNPEETARVFADGWFASGDYGQIDEGGFLTITGRVKDMIISGGLNVYPREIEEILYRLPGVVEACVVGVPDDRWGEVPAAVIVPGEGAVDADAVIGECRGQLATFKCPKHVLFHESPLPRNASGKVLKREVAPWARAELQ